MDSFNAALAQRLEKSLRAAAEGGTGRLSKFTNARLERIMGQVERLNGQAFDSIGKELPNRLREFIKNEVNGTAKTLQYAIPKGLGLSELPRPDLRSAASVVLDSPFLGFPLGQHISASALARVQAVEGVVRSGFQFGMSVNEVVPLVKGKLAGSTRQVRNLVRTATIHSATMAREEVWKANSDLVQKVQYVATLDSRTCPVCGDYDGMVFPVGEGVRPPLHFSCRCTTVPVLVPWDKVVPNAGKVPAEVRASMTGEVPASRNYNDWLRGQSAKVQDAALGKGKARLFRENPGMKIGDFVDDGARIKNLAELEAKFGTGVAAQELGAVPEEALALLKSEELLRSLNANISANLGPEDFESFAAGLKRGPSSQGRHVDLIEANAKVEKRWGMEVNQLNKKGFAQNKGDQFWVAFEDIKKAEAFGSGPVKSLAVDGRRAVAMLHPDQASALRAAGQNGSVKTFKLKKQGVLLVDEAGIAEAQAGLRATAKEIEDAAAAFLAEARGTLEGEAQLLYNRKLAEAKLLNSIANDPGLTAAFKGYDGIVYADGRVLLQNRGLLYGGPADEVAATVARPVAPVTPAKHVGDLAGLDDAHRLMTDAWLKKPSKNFDRLQPPADALRVEQKKKIVADLAERIQKKYPAMFEGMDERAVYREVNEYVSGWAETSGDTDIPAAALQKTAQRRFGLNRSVMDHMGTEEIMLEELGDISTAQFWKEVDRHLALKVNKFNGSTTEDFLNALLDVQYEATQDFFRSQGIKELTLVRGANYSGDVAQGLSQLELQPLSSFSGDIDIAKGFGDTIHFIKVDVKDIFGTARTGFGCLDEMEYIVMGKPYESWTVTVGKSAADLSAQSQAAWWEKNVFSPWKAKWRETYGTGTAVAEEAAVAAAPMTTSEILANGVITKVDDLPQYTFNPVKKVTVRDPVTGKEVTGYWKPADNSKALKVGSPEHTYYDDIIGLRNNGTLGQREVFASELDDILELGIVPKTVAREIDGVAGTLQLEAEGSSELLLKAIKEGVGPSTSQRFDAYFFDTILGNTDRHYANAFWDGKKYSAIDNGFTFPQNKPAKPYRWLRHDYAGPTKPNSGPETWFLPKDDPIRARWANLLEDPLLTERIEKATWLNQNARDAAIRRIEVLYKMLQSDTEFFDWVSMQDFMETAGLW